MNSRFANVRRLVPVACLGALLALAGCSLPPLSGGNGTAGVPRYAATAEVAQKIEGGKGVSGVRVQRFATSQAAGLLVVEAALQPLGKKPYDFYYRYHWLNASGGAVGKPDTWRPGSVMVSDTPRLLKGQASVPEAVDFRLELARERPEP
ncbi:hypothetical protein RAN3_0634 [plant metagenome]|uniref:YcfL protein: an outer membrane lipoprotein that is part of a salvage cluster n=1 Tax=plant metagenome TaxID=1297885 RepID=A0A484V7L3_9ZZZZ